MPTADTTHAFSVREKGYDVGEVEARIAALEARIVELEEGAAAQGRELLTDARLQALRLLVTAREDAEAMVEEARREAAAILDRARAGIVGTEPLPILEPHLEGIKSELPVPVQHAFVSVARRRVG